jgi:hypothetical protein
MELNQITCPQCGLANNCLAEACAQCGLIFVKNQDQKSAQASREEQKRKAIEEAEAILNQTPTLTETHALGNEDAKKIDPFEDTIEMQIPVEKADGASEEPQLDTKQDMETHEIKMEDIEDSSESQPDAIEAEELFLAEVTTAGAAGASITEIGASDADLPDASEKAAQSIDAKANSDGAQQDDPGPKEDDNSVTQSENAAAAKTKPQQNSEKENPDESKLETADPLEIQSPEDEVIELIDTKDNPAAETEPIGPETAFEEKKPPAGQEAAVESEVQIDPEATVETAQQPVEAHAEAKKQAPRESEDVQEREKQLRVLEALKKQREKQTKAEALNNQQAVQASAKKKMAMAKAEALKKQKAAQAKAEALKKQKAAQAKALALKKERANQARLEALKKQKEAQAKAEAAAQEIEVASDRIPLADSESTVGSHEKLLGLLKRYKGKAIGINYDNSAEIKAAELVDANEEFFSVLVKDKKLQYSYPLKTILTIVEGQEGVEAGDDDQMAKFDAVIKVYPLVLFK